jgi:hypothetical protein
MAFKMKGDPFKRKTESKEDLYARIIKENNMTKNKAGRYEDKFGRSVAQIRDGVPKHEQRRLKIDVEGNLVK